MGNVELFELCDTNPKTQCTDWRECIVYCTCGHLLRESAASRGAIQWTLDLLSIPNYVIKKGRPHGYRHGKTEEQRDPFVAHNLRRRCRKRGFGWIHDRFLKDERFRESQLEHDRTEEVCIQMDEIAQKKISLIPWRKESTFDTERIGGSLSIIFEKPNWGEVVLTSTKRCPH